MLSFPRTEREHKVPFILVSLQVAGSRGEDVTLSICITL